MSTEQIIVLVVVLLVLAAIVAAVLVMQSRKRKREHLRSTFGPEYDRTVESSQGRRDAERELAEREQHRSQLDIRPLPAADRQQFAERWRSTQADFVDQPEMAVRQADGLVGEVMGRRGYPVGDFEQMSRLVSVDHAEVVQEYRAAHEISELNDRKQATTEQLRQAMVHYRALFTDLLADGDAGGAGASAEAGGDRTRQDADRTPYGAHDSGLHDQGPHDSVPYDRGSADHGSADRDFADHGSADRDLADHGSADHSAHDHDRKASDGIASDRIATSRSEGVRVEPGGLDRPRVEDRDRPRS